VLISTPLASLTSSALVVLSNNFDELDVLLKLREEINMLGDGNYSVYAIMSHLYPQTYGVFR
jgi:hypothetical protein